MGKPLLTGMKYATLLLGTLAALLPMVVVLFASFKTSEEYRSTSPLQPPTNWLNIDNFVRAFTEGNMLVGFMNTTFILLVSLVGATITGAMIAYVLVRFDFRGKMLLIMGFLLATLIPAVTTQVATFQIINGLGLFNTHWAAIILYTGTDIIAVYIFMQFLKTFLQP